MGRFSEGLSVKAVQHTRELARIVSLPRYIVTEAEALRMADDLTALLKTPQGTQTLRPIQGFALMEAGCRNGLLANIEVGGGKTLIFALVAYVLGARRPLGLVPAKLLEKTQRELRALAYHWRVPNFIRLYSYELLGLVQSAQMLDIYQPDLIILDEAQKLANRKAARTKRVERYLREHPETRVIAMSGTITTRSIRDFAHIAAWCLKQGSPVPTTWSEIEDWAAALDEGSQADRNRIGLGALKVFLPADRRIGADDLNQARRAIGARIAETRGVVSSKEGELGASLTISALWGDKEVGLNKAVDDAFQKLREDWEAPDDWPLMDPLSVWRIAQELSLGFYYRWEPRPPADWMSARKEWAKACREILSDNRRNLDSELQVHNAVIDGLYPWAKPILDDWRKIEKTFTPNQVPVWLDDACLHAATLWALDNPGIVWVRHRAVGNALAKLSKLSYYQAQGKDTNGRSILDHPPGTSMIASFASCHEGFNLQHGWSRNLLLGGMPDGKAAEQWLGRTHRSGQKADEVTADLLCTSIAHINSLEQARRDAAFQEAITQKRQKLLFGDVTFPAAEDVASRPGFRWIKPVSTKE